MHIGRAHQLPPEIHTATVQHQRQTVQDAAPIAVSSRSVPTGESAAQPATYNPVTDLIIRQRSQAQSLADRPVFAADQAREAYEATPPAPAVVDERA